MSRFVKPGSWKRKGQAKHFTGAKMRKAARLEKSWLEKSKPKGKPSAVVQTDDGGKETND